MGLGTMADQQGRVVVDLEGSRFAIDLLQVLADKTKGNLTAEEQGELDEVVRELNMRFAAITRAVADHMSRGMPGGAAPAGVTLAPAPAAAPKPASAPGASKLIIP